MRYFLILILLLPLAVSAQRDWTDIEMEVTKLAPGIHRIFIANSVSAITFHGDEGLMVIDAGYEQSSEKLMEEIRKITDAQLEYLVNTHIHGDHTGGNKLLGKEARQIIAHPSVKEYLSAEQQQGDNIIPPFPDYAIPEKMVESETRMKFNGEEIVITPLGGGHTTGDLIIYFTNANVLVLGDLLFANYFPFIDTENGGNPITYMDNVNTIISQYPEDVILVGGHGPVYNMNQLKKWHQDLSETMEIVKSLKEEGLDASQIKENQALKNWESMGSFFITEDRWIETVYPFL